MGTWTVKLLDELRYVSKHCSVKARAEHLFVRLVHVDVADICQMNLVGASCGCNMKGG